MLSLGLRRHTELNNMVQPTLSFTGCCFDYEKWLRKS